MTLNRQGQLGPPTDEVDGPPIDTQPSSTSNADPTPSIPPPTADHGAESLKDPPKPKRQRTLTPNGELGPAIEDPLDLESKSARGYVIRCRGERQFANSAKEITYEVKFEKEWYGQNLSQLRDRLTEMFTDLLETVRQHERDLGKVVIFPQNMDPIVVPLMKWENMTVEQILSHIERVAQSKKSIDIDENFKIQVGIIQMPKGSRFCRLTALSGHHNRIIKKTLTLKP